MSAHRHPLTMLLNGLISLVIFLFVVSGAIFFIAKQQFEAPGPLVQTRSVIVPRGEALSEISRRLEREGIINDATLFLAGVFLSKSGDKLKAGEYLFPEHASMRDVMDLLVEGKAILHKFTVPEGLTSEQIVERLKEDEILVGEVGEIPPEGALLPDTYKFTRGTERMAMIERMRSARDRALARIWERRDKNLPLKSPEELVTLASIVEKETGKADERPRVAAVFVNRLRKSMRLQSDPTIIYGLVGGKGTLGRPILQSELDKKTEYNTYQIDGLPPTPIANPGLAALEATASPSRTNDLYFVASGDGGHVFAATLAEHNENVARWRKISAEMKRMEDEAAKNGTSAAAAGATEAAKDAKATAAKDAKDEPPLPPLRLNLQKPGLR
ncbi:MAG: endolytic transglycosylase MltG [Rhodobiaceae bacterium]|nr:endolytic transglycosylase MltG [Rhodobiaceae bacterium]